MTEARTFNPVWGIRIILASMLLSTRPHSGSVNKVRAWNEYIAGFEQAVENNGFPKIFLVPSIFPW